MGGGLTPSLLLVWLGKRGRASKEGSGFLSSGETVAGGADDHLSGIRHHLGRGWRVGDASVRSRDRLC